MTMLTIARFVFVICTLLLIGFELVWNHSNRQPVLITKWIIGGWAALWVIAFALLMANHISFPLHLEVMEGTVLQHFQRAAYFEPIYPEPSPEFVPLAYNPLFYVIAIPFSWFLSVNLLTLRLVAILGTIGSFVLVYIVIT